MRVNVNRNMAFWRKNKVQDENFALLKFLLFADLLCSRDILKKNSFWLKVVYKQDIFVILRINCILNIRDCRICRHFSLFLTTFQNDYA